MKVIVSSRPIQACVQAFSNTPKLRLQDLTRGDIQTYVHQTISPHPCMMTLRDSDHAQAAALLDELVERSSGIFLWVVLACRSIVEGLDNLDRWSELKQRIDELPPELESLFQHILSKIESRYQARAIRLLRICHQHARMNAPETLSTLGMALVGDSDVNISQLPVRKSLGRIERREKCVALEGRLRSRCYGLLEIKRLSNQCPPNCHCNIWERTAREGHDPLIDGAVIFMHRTVHDFLSTQGFIDFEQSMSEERDLECHPNVVLSYMSMQLATLNDLSRRWLDRQGMIDIRDALRCSQPVDGMTENDLAMIHSRLRMFVNHSFRSTKPLDECIKSDIARSDRNLGVILAVEFGLIEVVNAYEKWGMSLTRTQFAVQLLYYATTRPFTTHGRFKTLRGHVMEGCLLSKGCDPNEKIGNCGADCTIAKGMTPWKAALKLINEGILSSPEELVRPFLDAGANVEAAIVILETPTGRGDELVARARLKTLEIVKAHQSVLALQDKSRSTDSEPPMPTPRRSPSSSLARPNKRHRSVSFAKRHKKSKSAKTVTS
ncbi:hypothetical protein ACLMJK_006297 [Lecanora helva]